MEVRLEIPSLPRMELTAAQAAGALARRIGMSDDTAEAVGLAVVEACLNAFEHGGGGDVEVVIKIHDGGEPRLVVEVTDSGPGFDPDAVAPPDLGRALHGGRKRGWGVSLMRRLMDEVTIDSSGGRTRISMTKYLEAER